MITVYVHSNGTTTLGSFDPSAISDVLVRKDELIWIDLLAPTTDELQTIRSEFGFHPLAMEDVVRVHQRPKVDMYDGFALIIFYSMMRDAAQETVALTQLGIFAGENYVVTVHDRSIPALEETSDRWNQNVQEVGVRSVALLLYSILDAIVDSYFPILDDISDRLDFIEDITFTRYRAAHQKEIFRLKKELVTIRRVVAPERDVLNVLARRDMPMFDYAVVAYFQDVYDHTIRVTDAVDTYRDLLSNALEFHLTLASNRLNQVMKTLTASSIILMSMTLIASVYGMNFVHMPELTWRLGYPLALGLMLAIGTTMGYLFRRIDWL